jgi:phosphoribosylanthranilate isomerase
LVVRVKICGITRREDVDCAVAAGADAVGFIVGFERSPRNVTIARAGELIRGVPPFVDSVLVTTSELITKEAGDVRRVRPDAIQLYGDVVDPKEVRDAFGARLIRPYRLESSDAERAMEAAKGFDALLIDTFEPGSLGGTGKTSDWTVCEGIRWAIDPLPLVLSGGLRPENVVAAIRQVRPFAVDASSGVESSPGLKDAHRVQEFVRRAKTIDGGL